MKPRRLGCLTTGGILAMVFSLVVIGIGYAFNGASMFNPGELNAQASGNSLGGVLSHAELERECSACHPAFWQMVTMTDLCLDCHQDLLVQSKDPSSLHGAVMAGFESLNCRDCHIDHNGPNASMTEFLSDNFQHEMVGYSLSAHSQIQWEKELTCQDCHVDGFTGFTSQVCLDCHQQVDGQLMAAHHELFGQDCLVCHDGVETYGKDFNHDDYPFSLEGKHREVSCAACHSSARTLVDLQQTPLACKICHLQEDAHQGAMGEKCGVCHTPVGWDQAIFDHETVGFPLIGGHQDLDCENCHLDLTYQGIDPACASCHTDDEPHGGQFGADCAACHVVNSWQEVFFSHDGDYAADCTACHSVDKPANHYPGQCSACHLTSGWLPASFDHQVAGATDCLSCHRVDLPENHFSGQCSTCHSTTAWKPASFDHTFPLDHGDANQDCQLCHTTSSYTAYTCYGCHEHAPAEIRREHEGISNLEDCVRCHWDGREHEDEGGRDGDDDDDDD